MSDPVLVTGAGVIGPCGRGSHALWRSLLTGEANRCAIAHFDTYGSPVRYAGIVPGEEQRAGDPDRLLDLLLVAVRDALCDAGLEDERDLTLVVGTTDAGGNALAYLAGSDDAPPHCDPRSAFPGWLAQRAAERLLLEGDALTISSASASGGSALCVARDLLAAGDAHRVVVAGVDCVTQSAFHGLKSLRTLSADGCRPFSAERGGIGIAEGAAALVLETDRDGPSRAGVHALLIGCAASNETSHLALPCASGIVRAVELALADAQLGVDDVDLINAHGSGTRAGDAAEVAALRSVFDTKLNDIALVGTKGALWHWQGAAGLVEALACVLSLTNGTIAPTHRAEPLDSAWQDLDVVLEPRVTQLRSALSISSGLGGINTVAVFAALP